MIKDELPEKVRVSVGSATVLGLIGGRLDAAPTTIYMLTYYPGKCSADCGFCPQAKTSSSRADMLSRVTWPAFKAEDVLSKIEQAAEEKTIRRVCIQALNYPTVFDNIIKLAGEIRLRSKVPLSVSCSPLNRKQMEKLKEAGVDRISIALDAATEEIFDRVKGASAKSPYTWENQRRALKEAVEVFGEGFVYTHLIVGLGETEKEMTETIQWCVDSGVYPSLFAFTPILGTKLENRLSPNVQTYRRVQVARHLIIHMRTRFEKMKFDADGRLLDFGVSKEELKQVVDTGAPWLTSGCPGCNRPYYNEKPSGPLYNYPRPLTPNELSDNERQLEI